MQVQDSPKNPQQNSRTSTTSTATADVVLYNYYRSSSSYRVRIALELKKIPYQYQAVHLVQDGGQQHQPWFRQMNPKGEVPVLRHGEVSICQSMAIIDYLDRNWEGGGGVALFPHSPRERAMVVEFCEIINSGIQPLQNLKVLQQLQGRFQCGEEQKNEWGRFWMQEGFKALTQWLEGHKKNLSGSGPYVLGEQLTAAEAFLIPQIYNALRFKLDMQDFPQLLAIYQNCMQRQEFWQAAPEQQRDFPGT